MSWNVNEIGRQQSRASAVHQTNACVDELAMRSNVQLTNHMRLNLRGAIIRRRVVIEAQQYDSGKVIGQSFLSGICLLLLLILISRGRARQLDLKSPGSAL